MNKENRIGKNLIIFLIAISMLISLAGCGGIDLTEEESHKIAEYSAGLLLKYNRGYKGKLTNAQYIPPEDPVSIGSDPETIDEEQEETESEVIEESSGDFEENEDKKNSDSYFEGGLAEAIGLDGFEINYSGWEYVDKFPQEESELAFCMQAQPGNKLIAIHFTITNLSENPALCDILNNNTKFRLKVNEHDVINAQSTILLNDFKQFYEEMAGYGMTDTVLIFEESEEFCQSIQNLDLISVKDGDKKIIKLF